MPELSVAQRTNKLVRLTNELVKLPQVIGQSQKGNSAQTTNAVCLGALWMLGQAQRAFVQELLENLLPTIAFDQQSLSHLIHQLAEKDHYMPELTHLDNLQNKYALLKASFDIGSLPGHKHQSQSSLIARDSQDLLTATLSVEDLQQATQAFEEYVNQSRATNYEY